MLPFALVSARQKAPPGDEETLTDTGSQTAEALPEVIAPHLFVALECDRPAAGVARHSLANVDRVEVRRGIARGAERIFDKSDGSRVLVVQIPDPRLSSRHASIVVEGGRLSLVDLDSRNGTRVNGGRVTASTPLEDGDLVQVGHTLVRYRARLRVPLGAAADADSATEEERGPLSTVYPHLAQHAAALARVSCSTAPVLVLGETGTGKEVLARAIHRLSGRKGALVAVNCGALPATLLEGQLFGHVRGAFSGAVQNSTGFVRSADGGTLLLDEIGDLPAAAQPALLRVLQEQEVVPLGATTPVKVDLRVVAATNRPLEAAVAAGAFRSDLFARLAGFTFSLPPLRERADDVGVFLAAFAQGRQIRVTPSAGRALLEHDWPMNVRELFQVLDVATSLMKGELIDLSDLPRPVAAHATTAPKARPRSSPDPLLERLLESLRSHEGNVSDVARELGKARMQIQRWMKRYGIDAKSFRRPRLDS